MVNMQKAKKKLIKVMFFRKTIKTNNYKYLQITHFKSSYRINKQHFTKCYVKKKQISQFLIIFLLRLL